MPKKELPILGKFMLRLLYLLVLALLGCCAFLFYKMESYDTSIGDLQKNARDSRFELAQRERAFDGMKTQQEKEEASRKAGISHLHSALGYETEKEKYSDLTRLSKHVIDHTSGINQKAVDPPMDSAGLNVKTLLVALTAQIDRMKEAQARAEARAKAEDQAKVEAFIRMAAETKAEAEAKARAEAEARTKAEEARYALCVTLGYTSGEEDAPELSALSDVIKKDLARVNREGISPPLTPGQLNVKSLLSEMTRQIAVLTRNVEEKTLVIENLQAELDKK